MSEQEELGNKIEYEVLLLPLLILSYIIKTKESFKSEVDECIFYWVYKKEDIVEQK